MEDFLVGISPKPSPKVFQATGGLYDSIVVGVMAQTPNLDALFFRYTLLSALATMGWDQETPKLGVIVRLIGPQPAILRMSGLIQDIQLSKSRATIHHAPFSAEYYQQLDYELKHITHLICFHEANQPVNLTLRMMAKQQFVGVMDVVCDW